MPANQFDRVADLLQSAAIASNDTETLENLLQVRELIIHQDHSLLDNFFEEVVAFQHYPSIDLKKFVVTFIEDACLLDAGLLLKSVGCLSQLFNLSLHQEPPLSSLLCTIIPTVTLLYTRALTRAVKVGFVESGSLSGGGIEAGSLADNAFEYFRAIASLKDEIIRLLLPNSVSVMPGSTVVPPPPVWLTRLCSKMTDEARIAVVKLLETLIIVQSRRMPNSDDDADDLISLDQIPELPNSLLKSIVEASTAGSSTTALPGICLIRPRRLADEAERLFGGLAGLPLKRGAAGIGDEASIRKVVTGPVLDALVDCFVRVARQRPQFLDRAVQIFETVHVNLPTHFTETQVAMARRTLKSGLLSLLQHPAAVAEFKSRITILLTDLGATQHEVFEAMRRTAPDSDVTMHPTDSSTFSVAAMEQTSEKIASEHHSNAALDASSSQDIAPPSDPRRRSSMGMDELKRKKPERPLNFVEEDDDDDEEDEEEDELVERKRSRLEGVRPTDPRANRGRKQLLTGGVAVATLPEIAAKKMKKNMDQAAAATGSSFGVKVPDIDTITGSLVPKLTSANVADLVLLSMVTLPSQMPAAFNATYTPIAAAGTSAQVRHLARLLATQLIVWIEGEENPTVQSHQLTLLHQLFATEGENITTSSSSMSISTKTPTATITSGKEEANKLGTTRKNSGARTRRLKMDEDDEAAFMRAHVARVHSTTKPMTISVLNSGGLSAVGELNDATLFNLSVPPPLASPIAKLVPPSPMTGPRMVTPARPFSLDAVDTTLTRDTQRALAKDAYARILFASEGGGLLKSTSDATNPHENSAHDAARIKLLCRLLHKRLSSGDLYPDFIKFAMQNLKEGYDLLANLLMHVYSCYRGFALTEFATHHATISTPPLNEEREPEPEKSLQKREEQEADVDDVVLQSREQLRALQRLKAEREKEEKEDEDREGGRTRTTAASSDKKDGEDDSKLGSLSYYDALLTDLLTNLAAPDVRETYFGRILLEAPLITANAILMLKNYCSKPEQAPYGFQILRSLIQMRPTAQRKELLDVLLNFTSFEGAEIRKSALKATCQLADSHDKWEKQIEGYAIERLKRLLAPQPTAEMFTFNSEALTLPGQWTDDACQSCAYLLLGLMPHNPQRLLITLAEVYVGACDNVKRSLLRMVDTSICAIGLHSPHLLHLIDECPPGAEALVTRMIHILTDPRTAFARFRPITTTPSTGVAASGGVPAQANLTSIIPVMPPAALVDCVRRMYATRMHDVRCLIPVLVGLTKQEVIAALPMLVQLKEKVVKEVISRLLHASVATISAPDPRQGLENLPTPSESVTGPLTPEELLVAIHLLEFVKDPSQIGHTKPDGAAQAIKPYVEIPVILRACLHCFAERRLFTQERLSAAIGQLLDQPVLPTLFLRTVMQALAHYPRLAGYVINVLFRLIHKQVWKSPVLWAGFIRCCVKTRPQSYQVLLQLPPQQLQSVFTKEPSLRAQVRRYVENFSSAQRTHISRTVMHVLERETTPTPSTVDLKEKNLLAQELAQHPPKLPSVTATAANANGASTAQINEKQLAGDVLTTAADTEVKQEPIGSVEGGGGDVVEMFHSSILSSGSVTPTRDEEPTPITNDPYSNQPQAKEADDGSASPPAIMTTVDRGGKHPRSSLTESLQVSIDPKDFREPHSSLPSAPAKTAMSIDSEAGSYSPPALLSSASVTSSHPHNLAGIAVIARQASLIKPNLLLPPPTSSYSARRQDKGETEGRLEEAAKTRQLQTDRRQQHQRKRQNLDND